MNNGITDDNDTELLQLYLEVLGESEKLLLKLSEKYKRLKRVDPYKDKSRTLVYHHAKRLEKLGLIECKTISRAKFCKLTERGKALKEMILEKKRKAKERVKKEKPKPVDARAALLGSYSLIRALPPEVLSQLLATQSFSSFSSFSDSYSKKR